MISLDNKELTNLKDIIEEEKLFYKTLYTSSTRNSKKGIENLFNKLDIPQLNELDKALCDKPLTIEECTKALKILKNIESPGSCQMWDLVSKDLGSMDIEAIDINAMDMTSCSLVININSLNPTHSHGSSGILWDISGSFWLENLCLWQIAQWLIITLASMLPGGLCFWFSQCQGVLCGVSPESISSCWEV